MAVVYKARCNRLNRLVAIKILKEDLSKDDEFRRRFHAESQAVAMMSHPNIVSVYDVSHSENIDYIVMELIEGITLKQYMEQKGTLNWREALHFATQIAKALEHAHSRGIIHRDIKPHNIMVLKDGSVKVADFGIAQMATAQNTLTREALGSVHYISPEQAKGAHVDARTDLYSLGVVMYEMLTGRPPFDGDTPVSVAIQHINAKATSPRELNPSNQRGNARRLCGGALTDIDHNRLPVGQRRVLCRLGANHIAVGHVIARLIHGLDGHTDRHRVERGLRAGERHVDKIRHPVFLTAGGDRQLDRRADLCRSSGVR